MRCPRARPASPQATDGEGAGLRPLAVCRSFRERPPIPTSSPPELANLPPTAGGPDAARTRRVLLYSHDGTGLGHLRIVLGIGHALAGRRPMDALLLLTGSLQASAFDLPPNLDFVKLPALPKRLLYDALPAPASPPSSFRKVMYLREEIATAAIAAYAPDLVVVDHAPAGLFRELGRAIERLRAREPRPRLLLLMRDITFGPEQTRQIWRNEGIYPLLDEAYDRILVYGSQDVFDPIAEYAMSPAAAAKTRFCGYLTPRPARRTPEEVRAQLGVTGRLAVVSVGGGADGGPLLRAFLDGLPRRAPADLHAYVVTGPLLPEPERAAVAATAAALPNVVLVPFDPDFLGAARAADVVVGMGGYNSLCEAAAVGKRPVVVPRLPGPEEQLIRAERFARRGLATVVPPAELSAERLWAAVAAELERVAPPAGSLPFGGEARIVEEIVAALG